MSDGATPRAFAFIEGRLLLRSRGEGFSIPEISDLIEWLGEELLEGAAVPCTLRGAGSGARVYGLASGTALPDRFVVKGLRAAYHVLPTEHFRVAGAARQKVHWHETHAFCSRCGTATSPHEEHEALVCPACGQLHFPRIAPAVIVLVQRGREALLARSPHFAAGVYSTLAGFVEPGESAEECVHREIEEEVGVTVENLRYFGSQPHPFPHSLMLGFVTDWAGGEIRIEPTEIEDARWFDRDELPELPHPMSIARALIEDFRRRTGGT